MLLSPAAEALLMTTLVTWNVNSLSARETLVSLFLDEVSPDVLCIQELKLPDERVPRKLFEDRGYHVAIHGQPRWNGVLIASRTPLADIHTGLPDGDEGQSRLIAATLADGTRLVNLYCPQGSAADSPKFAYKLRFFDALLAWLQHSADPQAPLIVTGDINIAPEAQDLWSVEAFRNVPTFHPEEHVRWGRLVDWGLHDAARPHMPPKTFTFWDYRGGAFPRDMGMRIDHFLVTAPVLPRVQHAAVLRGWRHKRDHAGESLTASDHAPVVLTLAG